MRDQPQDASGGGFLVGGSHPSSLFTPEDLDEGHQAIADTVKHFWDREILPNLEDILEHRPGLVRSLMRKAAELGLMGISIPKRYGGMELDLISALVVGENTARDGSYMIWEGGHTTIGTLPIVYFGTADQKARYLPRLARLDMLAAYALSEPQAGSDALAVQTRAELVDGGQSYLLSGQKMWISNASEADLFTVFAKVGGQDFTAFLVERNSNGFRIGTEERKMGLKGSSTTAIYLDEVRVPATNLLGEVGRGHLIAFNILNLGRLRMGASALGAAKEVLRISIRYAKDRQAFGSSIAEFGAIRHKLAEMAIGIFATESVVWRTAGLIQDRQGGVGWDHPDASSKKLAGVREFATECSIVKVFASEMLDYVVDEGVQIHGGYGYHQDYAVEKAYRDSRINRIFEGTNEINRLLIARMLLKQSGSGKRPLGEEIDRVLSDPEAYAGKHAGRPYETTIASARTITLLAIGLAIGAHPEDLDDQQELLMLIADTVIDLYALESALIRSARLAERGRPFPAKDIAIVLGEVTLLRIAANARQVLGACCGPEESRQRIDMLHRITGSEARNLVLHRQNIARHLIDLESYRV